MKVTVDQFKSVLKPVQAQITKALIDMYSTNPDSGLEDAIKLINSKKDLLTKSVSPDLQVALEDKITGRVLNNFYNTVLNDLYLLYSSAKENDYTLQSLAIKLSSKFNELDKIIQTNEHDLLEIQYLFNNHQYYEAFSQDFQDNIEDTYPTVYNTRENILTLGSESSYDLKPDNISVKFLGGPERKSIPNYSPDKMIDGTTITGWYEVVGYKSKPNYLLDPKLDFVQAFLVGFLPSSTPYIIGTNFIPGSFPGVELDSQLTIGEFKSFNSEVVKVLSISNTGITITPFTNIHYPAEPIVYGSDLIQVNGACAIIDLEFDYPKVTNFIRLNPLCSFPINVVGIYYKNKNSWSKVASADSVMNIKSLSYESVVSSKIRIILEQPIGNLVNFKITDNSPLDSMYEKEFNTRSYNLETKLESYDPVDIVKANLNHTREFLVNRSRLESIITSNNTSSTGEAGNEAELMMDTLKTFADTSNEYANRFVYDIGMSEIQIMQNEFLPFSTFKSKPRALVQNTSSYSLQAKETLFNNTSIEHFIETEVGDQIPILNKYNVSPTGDIQSINEQLDININSGLTYAVLRFVPVTTSVNIIKKKQGNILETMSVSHTAGLVFIPQSFYDSKAIYETTYTVEDPDVHIRSNLNSSETRDVFKGTDSEAYIVLPKAPSLELGVINNDLFIKKETTQAVWTYNPTYSESWADKDNIGKAFPSNGVIIDNIYYGKECYDKIQRTDGLYLELYNMFSQFSGNPTIKIEQFFSTYTGQILSSNFIYKPFTVSVNGVEAECVSRFNGLPSSGFNAALEPHRQYMIQGNRIRFPSALDSSYEVEVNYRIKDTTLAYGATLKINKKSNFNVSPILHNALIGSLI